MKGYPVGVSLIAFELNFIYNDYKGGNQHVKRSINSGKDC